MLEVFTKIKSANLKSPWAYFSASLFLAIILDQLSKYFMLKYFPTNVFKSFGLFGHFAYFWEGFFVILIILFFILLKEIFLKKTLTSIFFGAIIGASIANIIDKITREFILDWIPIFNLRFNLADLIIIASGLALIVLLKKNESACL